MKTSLIALLIFLVSVATLRPVEAQLHATNTIRYATVEAGKFTFEVWSKSTGTPTDLRVGASSLGFTYNADALELPTITNINAKYTSGSQTGDYGAMTTSDQLVAGVPTFTVIIDGTAADATSGDLLSTNGTYGEPLFKVSFNIKDEYKTATVSWDRTNGGIQSYDFQVSENNFQGDINEATLPITLASFSAAPRPDGSVALQWTTAMEVNNKEFTVQRSADANHFTDLASLPGAGNSVQPLTYTYQDLFPLTGTSYYRLKQEDLDGTETYSQIVAVKTAGTALPSITILSAQPNPFQGNTVINFGLRDAAKVNLTLSDQMGNVVQTAEIDGRAGYNAYTLAADQLNEGIYFLHLSSASGSTTFKLVKGQ